MSLQHTADTFRPLVKVLGLAAATASSSSAFTATNAASTSSTSTASGTTSPLTDAQLELLLEHLADPNFTSSRENHAQIGSALTSLKFTGLDAQSKTYALAARIFLDRCLQVTVPPLDSSFFQPSDLDFNAPYQGTLDLVGTGGDGHDTFNVSTTAAMVAAGVPGVRVCKHGAKASSSTSGSADLLLSLGIPLLTLPPSQLPVVLSRAKFSFLFAQLYHPSLAPLGPIRRSLGFPTLFNVLGPLINPARPERCILGVHSPYLGPTFAEALLTRGVQRAWIVCGLEGLDEISPSGHTNVWQIEKGQITHFQIHPSDFGLPTHSLSNVGSHTSSENASIVLHLFSSFFSKEKVSQLDLNQFQDPISKKIASELPFFPKNVNFKAILDYILLQAAALLYVGGYAETLQNATELALQSIQSGSALKALESFRNHAILAVQHQQSSASTTTTDDQDQYSYLPKPRKDSSVSTNE